MVSSCYVNVSEMYLIHIQINRSIKSDSELTYDHELWEMTEGVARLRPQKGAPSCLKMSVEMVWMSNEGQVMLEEN